MIPYDDLVAALNNWRARQGLPVATGPSMTGSGPSAAPAGGAQGPSMINTPASGPARTAPPNAPPKAGGYQPPPLATPETMEDSLDVDDAALLEEAVYDNEGGDFAMNFGAPVENDGESTQMGHAPPDASPRSGHDSFGGETDFDPKSRKPW
jgi:hypothetical protein